jgi:NTE family protein
MSIVSAAAPRAGLVLSGGGMRGAYEVGVLAGVVDTLTRAGLARPGLFRFVAGTSVGAINAAFVAANSDRPDLGISRLCEIWKRLHLGTHLSIRAGAFIRSLLKGAEKAPASVRLGRSLVDARPLEQLVRESIDWAQLHRNISRDVLGGLFIAALEIATGLTIIFVEGSPNVHYAPSRDPRRRARFGPISSAHVLASAAIPLLFPAQRIGRSYYCDGGLRFNTPLAPVIRAGADRVFVISTTHLRFAPEATGEVAQARTLHQYPTATFIAGKILNALLLDPIDYDLQVLERTNHLLDVLDRVLTPEEQAALEAVLSEQRGAPYRKVVPLIFAPSEDLGVVAAEFLREHVDELELDFVARHAFRRIAQSSKGKTADWLTYLLFEGKFADVLIDLGRRDVAARADEVIEFFRPIADDVATEIAL